MTVRSLGRVAAGRRRSARRSVSTILLLPITGRRRMALARRVLGLPIPASRSTPGVIRSRLAVGGSRRLAIRSGLAIPRTLVVPAVLARRRSRGKATLARGLLVLRIIRVIDSTKHQFRTLGFVSADPTSQRPEYCWFTHPKFPSQVNRRHGAHHFVLFNFKVYTVSDSRATHLGEFHLLDVQSIKFPMLGSSSRERRNSRALLSLPTCENWKDTAPRPQGVRDTSSTA